MKLNATLANDQTQSKKLTFFDLFYFLIRFAETNGDMS